MSYSIIFTYTHSLIPVMSPMRLQTSFYLQTVTLFHSYLAYPFSPPPISPPLSVPPFSTAPTTAGLHHSTPSLSSSPFIPIPKAHCWFFLSAPRRHYTCQAGCSLWRPSLLISMVLILTSAIFASSKKIRFAERQIFKGTLRYSAHLKIPGKCYTCSPPLPYLSPFLSWMSC